MCKTLHTVVASNSRDNTPWSLFAYASRYVQSFTCSYHQRLPPRSLYYWLFAPHIDGCYSSRISLSRWIAHSTQRQPRVCNNISSFLQRTAPIARSFCEGCTWHNLHILVTAPSCCDLKARAACAQSFAPWQQATIDITCHDHSSRMLVLTFNRSLARIIRDYTPRSLHYFLAAQRRWVFSSRTSSSWWMTVAHSTQRQSRGCNSLKKRYCFSFLHVSLEVFLNEV